MAKSAGTYPLTGGGRTLAKPRKPDGGGKKHNRKKTWFSSGGAKSDNRGQPQAWPQDNPPAFILAHREMERKLAEAEAERAEAREAAKKS